MPFLVGRDVTCHLQLDSVKASRFHAQLKATTVPDCLFLTDQGSTNGTYVNGVRFMEPVPVGHGDLIRFADEDWTLELLDEAVQPETVRSLRLLNSGDSETIIPEPHPHPA
ncbi:MAG: FHA domain-containing protein [Pseudomonadota bacterium]